MISRRMLFGAVVATIAAATAGAAGGARAQTQYYVQDPSGHRYPMTPAR